MIYSLFSIATLLVIIAFLINNILQRKRAEKQLRQSEKNFKSIFNNAREGLFQATLEGKFIRVNQALANILRCESPQDVVATYKNLEKDLHVNHLQQKHLLEQIKEHGNAAMEIDVYCKNKEIITVLLHCHEIVDEEGELLYLEGSITDMTEYKKTQEIIIQTEKMISLGGLSAGIAHEIKNPLTSVIHASQVALNRLIEDTPANQEALERTKITREALSHYCTTREIPYLLTSIKDAGLRADQIIEDMLSFSRKTIGEFNDESIIDIINEAVSIAQKDYSLEESYKFKNISIETHFEKDLPQISCSKSKIKQVLFNILMNSAEAMAENRTIEPQIVVEAMKKNDRMQIEIRDNGPGMDKLVQERIFEPFYTTKGRKKGTGLGLSISYFIITENHNGFLSVASSPGKGATFTIQLPFTNEPQEFSYH